MRFIVQKFKKVAFICPDGAERRPVKFHCSHCAIRTAAGFARFILPYRETRTGVRQKFQACRIIRSRRGLEASLDSTEPVLSAVLLNVKYLAPSEKFSMKSV